MHIVIAGGSGFVGTHLATLCIQEQHTVSIITHNTDVSKLRARLAKQYDWARSIDIINYHDYVGQGDVLVNLAGENIGAKPIFGKRLEVIKNSRLSVLDTLADELALPPVFIQASAVGAYPSVHSKLMTEQAEVANIDAPDCDPLSKIALAVEKRARELHQNFEFRKFHIARIGVVLGRDGGFMKTLAKLPPFTVVNGHNYIPFIEVDDASRALLLMAQEQVSSEIVNLTSPRHATLKEVMQCCFKNSHLPRIPLFTGIFKIGGDHRSKLLGVDQKIHPQALLDADFKFSYADISTIP